MKNQPKRLPRNRSKKLYGFPIDPIKNVSDQFQITEAIEILEKQNGRDIKTQTLIFAYVWDKQKRSINQISIGNWWILTTIFYIDIWPGLPGREWTFLLSQAQHWTFRIKSYVLNFRCLWFTLLLNLQSVTENWSTRK